MTKTKPHDVPLPAAGEVVLTRLEACRVARIGLSTFDRAVAANRLRVQRSGRKITVTREELSRFMGLNQAHA
jgi:excisionase family DNA binding protein